MPKWEGDIGWKYGAYFLVKNRNIPRVLKAANVYFVVPMLWIGSSI
ncbi:MAG: hypothetical protein CM1200mP3_17030 [Chloroflexota bacterium]|nr:MAG: hypothetical protein CM1200mP3_17030 [Chloroflexota bacterium]